MSPSPRSRGPFVDERVGDGRFGSVSDYVRELISRDQRELQREDVERRLLDALESRRGEMTEMDWRSSERHSRRSADDEAS